MDEEPQSITENRENGQIYIVSQVGSFLWVMDPNPPKEQFPPTKTPVSAPAMHPTLQVETRDSSILTLHRYLAHPTL
jgi:hypothetical protein